MAQSHDLFFKQTFSYSEHAVDFLKFALPAQLAQEIDYPTFRTFYPTFRTSIIVFENYDFI
jgi:hypothetical protein